MLAVPTIALVSVPIRERISGLVCLSIMGGRPTATNSGWHDAGHQMDQSSMTIEGVPEGAEKSAAFRRLADSHLTEAYPQSTDGPP